MNASFKCSNLTSTEFKDSYTNDIIVEWNKGIGDTKFSKIIAKIIQI
jgi:hypothetical protein